MDDQQERLLNMIHLVQDYKIMLELIELYEKLTAFVDENYHAHDADVIHRLRILIKNKRKELLNKDYEEEGEEEGE